MLYYSEKYLKARKKLLEAEIALKDQREEVAKLRRALPMGAKVDVDYLFDSLDGKVSLSSLFTKEHLIIIHLMFSPEDEKACPMCSLFADGYDNLVRHISSKVDFVVIAKAPIKKLTAWGKKRGWEHLRLLSSYENSFNSDFKVEDVSGGQYPAVSVFTKESSGDIFHFYRTEASLTNTHHRGIDLFSPIWHFFDLLPDGRGEWMPEDARDLVVDEKTCC